MGQNISLYVLSLIDKQIYSVQNVMDAEYPRNIKKVRDRGIDKTLNLFGHVDVSETKDKRNCKTYDF
ncbi:uncharacterized protein RHIMIDRAFT_259064 [Rhizopus microsporus ATCC 52813]|uniref:Uncharacterized protein n=1 Tax=Rhizopus microsporus ATCC 52813 TaxID=1340429 RepID=A0A2G4SNX6_RHIZD|nr:uncharacterized protein RHIMIDRAFT_259064 [Rhizopus microsporus ATCC 52813]PHZ10488.1 hypothetical protein RHIMIDRAFT_259064 [Rhizopus microsporus ATCC 52813]